MNYKIPEGRGQLLIFASSLITFELAQDLT